VEEAPRQRSRLPLTLVLMAAVLAGAGVFFLVKAQSSDQGVDTQGMTEVNGQIDSALEKIFSFSYDKLDESSAAARDVLAGTAIGEYDKLIEQVKAQAPAQKLVLATKVTTAGVKSLDGDRAELLVFLDQVATRVDTGKTSGSAAALSVTAERQNGVWKITGLVPR
jgi:Mce-associated membrane protein